MLEVAPATTPEALDQTRALIRAFVGWHRGRHQEDLELIDEYFDPEEFESELDSLPGKYAPPAGSLLLASLAGRPVGCVALRAIDERRCEMKRMFVDPGVQGKGVGRALAEALIREARAIGYSSMLLDTSFRQVEALRLYASLGFRRVEPYYELPERLQSWLVFMELPL